MPIQSLNGCLMALAQLLMALLQPIQPLNGSLVSLCQLMHSVRQLSQLPKLSNTISRSAAGRLS